MKGVVLVVLDDIYDDVAPTFLQFSRVDVEWVIVDDDLQ
jgi:hypothetical protein